MPKNYKNIDWLALSDTLLTEYETDERSPVCFDPERPQAVDFALSLPLRSRCSEAKNHGIRLNVHSLAAHAGCSFGTAQKYYMEAVRKLPTKFTATDKLLDHSNRWARLADSFCTDGRFFDSFTKTEWERYLSKSVATTLRNETYGGGYVKPLAA